MLRNHQIKIANTGPGQPSLCGLRYLCCRPLPRCQDLQNIKKSQILKPVSVVPTMHRASGQALCFNVAVICAQHIGVCDDDPRPERLGGSSSVRETRPVFTQCGALCAGCVLSCWLSSRVRGMGFAAAPTRGRWWRGGRGNFVFGCEMSSAS